MIRHLILLLCLILMCLPTFLSAEPVQAATTLSPTSIVAFQQSEADKPKGSSSSKPPLNQSQNPEHGSTGDIVLPRFEKSNSSLIADGFLTGKAVGYKAGKAVKDYSCNKFAVKCFEER